MAVTIKQTEPVPSAYPDVPEGLSTAAAALDSDMVWARIEAFIAHRWTARDVVWIVEGDGEWTPPLTPATVSTVEVWESNAWSETTPSASPLGGYDLPGDGPYRVSATVGSGTVPAEVDEAFKRLAEYMAESNDRPGVASYSVNLDGAISEEYDRAPTWLARAMSYSGAGDLLRNYRRA